MRRTESQVKKMTVKPRPSSGADSKFAFSTFTFTDSVTNNKIILKDAHQKYHHSQPSASPVLMEKREVNNLSSCLSMLKTTKMFQKDALRSKLFKSAHHSRNPSAGADENLHETKLGLQKVLQTSIHEVSKQELQEWLSDGNKRINPQVMSLHSLSGHKLTRSNVMDIISKKDKPVEEEPKILQNKVVDQEQDFTQGNQLMEKAQCALLNMRSNVSHLVRPSVDKELFQKLHLACKGKKARLKRKTRLEVSGSEWDQGVFKPARVGERVNRMERKLYQKRRPQSEQQKELIFAVQNNLLFDMEMLLYSKASLIDICDLKGNNLLHIAAKSRNQQFFQFLLKRAGPKSLQSKNNLGRTPLDVARVYAVEGIVNLIKNYQVVH